VLGLLDDTYVRRVLRRSRAIAGPLLAAHLSCSSVCQCVCVVSVLSGAQLEQIWISF
jgi:hypothetical protein